MTHRTVRGVFRMILYAAADLIWATKIKGVADGLGVACRPARDLAMLEARLSDCQVSAFLVDLDKGEEALGLIRRAKLGRSDPDARKVRVIAWGPHVQKDLLQAARDAGADDVMTRGAFDHSLADLLLKLSAIDAH